MLKTILITAIATFVITAGWSYFAEKKIKLNFEFILASLLNELDELSLKLGYANWKHYLVEVKGEDYASRAWGNIISTIEYLKGK